MLRALLIALCVCSSLPLTGCGQSGALYFDEAPPSDQLPPSRKASPAAPAPEDTTTEQ